MRNNRLIRKRGNRNREEVEEIDITSLLDILVIMLVFLIRSYNASGVVINVPKNIKLPDSKSQSLNTAGVVVQVAPTGIWVDDKEVVNTEKKVSIVYDHEGRRIVPLYNELIQKKQDIKRTEKMSPNATKFTGTINLVVDKSIKYNYVKKLLYTCAEAGYLRYKFVVLGPQM